MDKMTRFARKFKVGLPDYIKLSMSEQTCKKMKVWWPNCIKLKKSDPDIALLKVEWPTMHLILLES